MAIFPIFFLCNIGQENVFYDILERKNAFLGYKNKKFKQSKIWYFSKRINPWFLSKNAHFSHFFFLGNKGNENVFYDILEQENVFLGYKNKRFKQWKIEVFTKGLTHAFGQKMASFPIFFLGNFSQESVFSDILEQKNAFQGYKNKKFQKSKNWHFLKGLTDGFGPKMAIFPTFFFQEILARKMSYMIS